MEIYTAMMIAMLAGQPHPTVGNKAYDNMYDCIREGIPYWINELGFEQFHPENVFEDDIATSTFYVEGGEVGFKIACVKTELVGYTRTK